MKYRIIGAVLVAVLAAVALAGDYTVDTTTPVVAEGEYYGLGTNLVTDPFFTKATLEEWEFKNWAIESGVADSDSSGTAYMYKSIIRQGETYRVRAVASNATGTDSLGFFVGTLPANYDADVVLSNAEYVASEADIGGAAGSLNIDFVAHSTYTGSGQGVFAIIAGSALDVDIDSVYVQKFEGDPGWVQGLADSSTVTYYLPNGDSLSSWTQYIRTTEAWFKADGIKGFRVAKDSVLVHENWRQ